MISDDRKRREAREKGGSGRESEEGEGEWGGGGGLSDRMLACMYSRAAHAHAIRGNLNVIDYLAAHRVWRQAARGHSPFDSCYYGREGIEAGGTTFRGSMDQPGQIRSPRASDAQFTAPAAVAHRRWCVFYQIRSFCFPGPEPVLCTKALQSPCRRRIDVLGHSNVSQMAKMMCFCCAGSLWAGGRGGGGGTSCRNGFLASARGKSLGVT